MLVMITDSWIKRGTESLHKLLNELVSRPSIFLLGQILCKWYNSMIFQQKHVLTWCVNSIFSILCFLNLSEFLLKKSIRFVWCNNGLISTSRAAIFPHLQFPVVLGICLVCPLVIFQPVIAECNLFLRWMMKWWWWCWNIGTCSSLQATWRWRTM